MPENTIFKTDSAFKDFDESDNDFFNLHYSSDNYTYKVSENKVKCMNCPPEETDEYNDGNEDTLDINVNDKKINISSPNIKINENGISITDDSTNNKEFKELKINKNGIIIKTK